MGAIIRRELNAYFLSPIGYVFLTIYLFITGFAFSATVQSQLTNLSEVFGFLQTIVMLVVPILTMRLLSEERKNKSDQALMTAPVSLSSIVYGKYIAAALMYTLASVMLIVYAIVLSVFSPFMWAEFFANFIGTLLMGYALIAVGLFISSLTENQVISAITSFAAVLLLMFMQSFLVNVGQPLTDIMDNIAVVARLQSFYSGTIVFSDIFYFISFVALFNFLTTRVLERRRYA